MLCTKCKVREGLLTADKNLPSIRCEWGGKGLEKRFCVFFPFIESSICYTCNKEKYFKIEYPLPKSKSYVANVEGNITIYKGELIYGRKRKGANLTLARLFSSI